jgi:hypothetical protein
MKFSDIPKFTKDAAYKVNISWGYLEDWLKQQASDCPLDLSPEYQRDHVWTEQQQIRYVEYILRGGKTGREIHFNCPNWMNFGKKPNKWYTTIELVDGKQRLHAVLRFLRDEISVFGHKYSEFEGPLRLSGPDFIIHVNNLQTPKEVLQWYVDMNAGGTVHTEAEINKVRKMIEETK